MISDLRGLPDGTHLHADVCVVGAGPVGIAVARELIGSGRSVLLLETGGVDPDPAADALNDGEVVGLPLPTLHDGRTRALGGATKLWPGQCIRLDPEDLAEREWVPHSGWPITPAELVPYYERAGEWFRMPREAFDEQAWRRFGTTPPPFRPGTLVPRSSMYTPVPDSGTHYRAELEAAADVRVLLHATATRVHTGPDGVTGVTVREVGGRSAHVDAGAVVLCGGGVENARLLLASDVGNAHDQVGRWFSEHPVLWVDLDVDDPVRLQEFFGLHGRGAIRYLPKVRLAPEVQREQRTLSAVADLIWEHRETEGLSAARELSSALQGRRRPRLGPGGLRRAAGELGPVARAGFRRFALGRPSAGPLERARLKILFEQAPNPDSRVTLSTATDALGVPKARVDWRLTEADRRTAQVWTGLLDTEFRRLGMARLRSIGGLGDLDRLSGPDWTAGYEEACHHMGTTRMSTDPRTGVVDADGQVHGVPGLYASGSSVFPTGGYANPTLTIVALALRLADHLKQTPVRASRPAGLQDATG